MIATNVTMNGTDFIIEDDTLVSCVCAGGDVAIPDGVAKIGDGAFMDCTRLTGVTIPAGVVRIGQAAFRGCFGLASVNIPESVAEIGERAFKDCINLKAVRFDGTRKQWDKLWIENGNHMLLKADIRFAGEADDADGACASPRPTVIHVIDGVEYVRLDDLGIIGEIMKASGRMEY